MKTGNDALTDKDKNLMEAADMFQKNWVAKYPDKAELDGKFTYSKRHIKRMDRLLKNYDSWFYRATCTTKRQVVAASVVILIGFNTLMITNVEARAAVINFSVEVYERFSTIVFQNEETTPNTIIDFYEPEYVPDGFEKTNSENLQIFCKTTYERGDEQIIFNQTILSEAKVHADSEGSTVENIMINEEAGVIIYNKGYYTVFWSNGIYNFDLFGKDKDDILNMARSIKIIE